MLLYMISLAHNPDARATRTDVRVKEARERQHLQDLISDKLVVFVDPAFLQADNVV